MDFEAFKYFGDGAKNVDAAKFWCTWPIFSPKKIDQLVSNWEDWERLQFLIVWMDLFRSQGLFQVSLFTLHLWDNYRCKLKSRRYCAQNAFIKYFLIWTSLLKIFWGAIAKTSYFYFGRLILTWPIVSLEFHYQQFSELSRVWFSLMVFFAFHKHD